MHSLTRFSLWRAHKISGLHGNWRFLHLRMGIITLKLLSKSREKEDVSFDYSNNATSRSNQPLQ